MITSDELRLALLALLAGDVTAIPAVLDALQDLNRDADTKWLLRLIGYEDRSILESRKSLPRYFGAKDMREAFINTVRANFWLDIREGGLPAALDNIRDHYSKVTDDQPADNPEVSQDDQVLGGESGTSA